jgi:hypothetical protein
MVNSQSEYVNALFFKKQPFQPNDKIDQKTRPIPIAKARTKKAAKIINAGKRKRG